MSRWFNGLGVVVFAGLCAVAVGGQPDPASGPTGAVAGRVLDGDGKPLKGAEVVVQLDVEARKGGSKEKKPVKVASGETDKDGVYRIEPVPVGKVRVAARVDQSKDHSFTFARAGGPVFEVAAHKITKIEDIKIQIGEESKGAGMRGK